MGGQATKSKKLSIKKPLQRAGLVFIFVFCLMALVNFPIIDITLHDATTKATINSVDRRGYAAYDYRVNGQTYPRHRRFSGPPYPSPGGEFVIHYSTVRPYLSKPEEDIGFDGLLILIFPLVAAWSAYADMIGRRRNKIK